MGRGAFTKPGRRSTESRSDDASDSARSTKTFSDRRRWAALLGRPGWVALVGLALALALAVFLGFFIPSAVENNLLRSRTDLIHHVAADLMEEGVLEANGLPDDLAELDAAVRLHLLGADVFGVILWDRNGVVVYSDAPELIGEIGDSDKVARALQGYPVVDNPAEEESGSRSSSGIPLTFAPPPGHTAILEYYVPVLSATGQVVSVLEVYEDATAIQSTLASTRLIVRVSILLGLGVLLVFLLVLSRASLRVLDARRRHAERLVAEMATAQEDERGRIIGALHDDIGQPLYRVLYGIEGSLSQLDPDNAVHEELDRMRGLVRGIDEALRSELLMLHQGAIDENDLDTLLVHLVEDARAESRLDITLSLGSHVALGEGPRATLFRATREAVMNARKHSGASEVKITVTESRQRVIVDVDDDGRGFGGELGLGLTTTRDRLEAIGGGLQMVAADGGGTRFRAWVPMPLEVAPT